MCGFVGFVGFNGKSLIRSKEIIQSMTSFLVHRGPDSHGLWTDPYHEIAIGHRRLSIQDVTSAGNQPMTSRSGRYILAFNGEIYNHQDLRKEIECQRLEANWIGHSDTESLLCSIEHWGLEKTLQKIKGMFAFSLWDKKNGELFLVRDRIGEKPLYYSKLNNSLIFSSELKAIKAHPDFEKKINIDAINLQLNYQYIPAPYSIYQNVWKLRPGSYLKLNFSRKNRVDEDALSPKQYWSFRDVVTSGKQLINTRSESFLIEKLHFMLEKAVKNQLLSDVPLGAFLSGGVDSSLIAALMQKESSTKIKTFSIGFNDQNYDEAIYAKQVSQQIGTDHHELYVSSKEAQDVIPKLPVLFDEPFSDVSQIPNFILAKFAKEKVTVCLTGDGADEVFGGYRRYNLAMQLWSYLEVVPDGFKNSLFKLLHRTSIKTLAMMLNSSQQFLFKKDNTFPFADKLYKSASLLKAKSFNEFYAMLVSFKWDLTDPIVRSYKYHNFIQDLAAEYQDLNNIDLMMAIDTLTYLPDDILTKVDRTSMGTSLETRIPYLDHKIVEFAWKLPTNLKIKKDNGKWILKKVLQKYLPKNLIDRKKTGFGVPIESWLRSSLREWGEDLLNESNLKDEGFFDHKLIQRMWNEHLTGKRNWKQPVWNILMFQAWLDQEKKY